jgi:hypothetical protein
LVTRAGHWTEIISRGKEQEQKQDTESKATREIRIKQKVTEIREQKVRKKEKKQRKY